MSARRQPSGRPSRPAREAAVRRGPGALRVLADGVGAVLLAPSAVAVVLLAAVVSVPVHELVEPVVSAVGGVLAVALAARGVDEAPARETSLFVRAVLGLVAVLLAAAPVALGLLALVVPGVYVALRLFLVIPAVVVGERGPVDALYASWELTDGMVLTLLGVYVALFVVGFTIGFVVLVVTRSLAVMQVVLGVVLGAPIVGAQAALYVQLAEE